MKNETIPYFDVITEMAEYLQEHYDISENSIFELIKLTSWKIALKKEGHDEDKLGKATKYTIDQGMQRFKRKGTFEDYVELIGYVVKSLPQTGIHHDEKEITRKALLKIVRKHMHHGVVVTTADSGDIQVTDNGTLTGKNVYGGVFLAQLPYIREHFGKSGANDLMKEMIKNGYKGPTTIREVNRSVKYPIVYLCIYNKAFIDLFGEEHFEKMARNSAKKKGIVGVFVRWAGTPRVVIKKSPEYWQKFCDFGRLEPKLKEEDRGVLRLLNGRVNSLFCKYLTNYFMGVGEAINYEVAVRHTKCVFEGSDCCEWEISWGNNKYKTEVTTPKHTEDPGSRLSMEKGEVIPVDKSFTGKGALTSNEIYNLVVSELEGYLGDILALGITKKALQKVGTSEDYVTVSEMKKALKAHIAPSLQSFMFPDKAEECVRAIENKIIARKQDVR